MQSPEGRISSFTGSPNFTMSGATPGTVAASQSPVTTTQRLFGAEGGAGGSSAEKPTSNSWAQPQQLQETQEMDEFASHFTYPWLKGIDSTTMQRPKSLDAIRKKIKFDAMSGMERQYWEIKSKFFDVVVFFKKGKFYELYDCDAVIGSREFGLKMTHDSTNRGKMRMSGVPEQSFAQWSRLFIFRGYKVGRVEQLVLGSEEDEDTPPKKGPVKKGPTIVPRELVQIITSATLTDAASVVDPQPMYVMSISHGSSNQATFAEALVFDASRREVLRCPCESLAEVATLVSQLQPKEVILTDLESTVADEDKQRHSDINKYIGAQQGDLGFVVERIDTQLWAKVASRHCTSGVNATPSALGLMHAYLTYLKIDKQFNVLEAVTGMSDCTSRPSSVQQALRVGTYSQHKAAAIGLELNANTQGMSPSKVKAPTSILRQELTSRHTGLAMDAATIENLEVLRSLADGTTANTLVAHLCHCTTPGGKRLFRQWLLRPVSDPAVIEARQEATFSGLIEGQLLDVISSALGMKQGNEVGSQGGEVGSPTSRNKRDRDGDESCAQAGSGASNLKTFDFERALARLGDVAAQSERVAFIDPLVHYNQTLDLILGTLKAGEGLLELSLALKSHPLFCPGATAAVCPPLLMELVDSLEMIQPVLEHIGSKFDRKKAIQERYIIPTRGEYPAFDEAEQLKAGAENTLHKNFLGKHFTEVFGGAAANFSSIGKDIYLVEVGNTVAKNASNHPKFASLCLAERARTARTVKFSCGHPDFVAAVDNFKKAETDRANALNAVLKSLAESFIANFIAFFNAGHALAYLDCLCSLAQQELILSASGGCVCRPKVVAPKSPNATLAAASLATAGVWHPFVRSAASGDGSASASSAVPNDLNLGGEQQQQQQPDEIAGSGGRVLVLTGPNMGGKSTLMRTVALAFLMAQLGGPVCAERFDFSPVTRIFTRIGARDSLNQGHSTLYVELSETATILQQADGQSLCLVDELGRGTSTFDGYSIASATLDALLAQQPESPLVLFSTHYHDLANAVASRNAVLVPETTRAISTTTTAPPAQTRSSVQLGYMDFKVVERKQEVSIVAPQQPTAIKEEEGAENEATQKKRHILQDIVFQYKLVPGVCQRSFGCEVALRAGLDQKVVKSAMEQSSRFGQWNTQEKKKNLVRSFLL